MLIAVSPTGNIADHFIIVVRKLSVNFFQRVPLKVKLTGRAEAAALARPASGGNRAAIAACQLA